MDQLQQARYDRVFDAYAEEGYLTRNGFENSTRVLAEIQGRSADEPAIAAFRNELGSIWDGLAAIADLDNDGKITREEWRTAAEGITTSLRESQQGGAPFPFDHWVELLYGAIDADGDGNITKEEYSEWLKALGLADDTDIDSAFAGFDTNQDGTLSRDEFLNLYHQFWSEFDPSVPGHRWIGP